MISLRRVIPSLVLALLVTGQLSAQQRPANSVVTAIAADIEGVQKQLSQLAAAFPADKWDWRPGQGVRSVGEVYLHVAADNYLIGAATGTAAPAETGIKATDYSTAVTFEQKKLSREAVIAEIERSFAFLKKALNDLPESKLPEPSAFGANSTNQATIILAATHIHEHLGQLIAYARVNSIVPPWSR